MVGFPEFTHQSATIADAQALILSATRLRGYSENRKRKPVRADAPFFAAQFPNKAIAEIGRDKANRLINRMKTHRLPNQELRVLADHIKVGPPRASSDVPFQFGECRILMARYDLVDSTP